MTYGGWIIMILSVGFVTSLFVWTVARVIRTPDASTRLHGEIDIDTRDRDT